MPIEITDQALDEIKKIFTTKGIPLDYGLRIATKGAGCGVGFKLGFDACKEGDAAYELGGVNIWVQKRELLFLAGRKITFYDESDGRGFVFV